MARRKRKSSENSVSLFPFLSILACVIGTLTLMITALALGQMDSPALASLDRLDAAQKSSAQDEQAIRDLEQRLAELSAGASESQQELATKQAQLDRLRQEQAKLQADRIRRLAEPLPEPPPVDEAALQRQLDELKQQIAAQKKSKDQLQAELAKRKSPPEEAVVSVRPTGSGSNLEPTFVECTSDSVVIYAEDETSHRVRRGQLASDAKFLQLLKRVAKAEEETVVFLVRDDAVSTYVAAKGVASSHYARNGKIPVIGHGQIDLSMFQEQE